MAMFGPQQYKTFQGALEAFLANEFPQLSGKLARIALVNGIYQMVRKFFPDTSHLKQGQVLWTTIHKDERGAYGKTITDSKLTPVVLDLIPPEDIIERAKARNSGTSKKKPQQGFVSRHTIRMDA